MKKTAVLVLVFLSLFGGGISHGQENHISGISTAVGSFSHNGFVPHEVILFGGELVVSDKDNHRLSVVDVTTGSVTMTYGGYGSDYNKLRFPRGLAVYGKELMVCDSYNNRIVFLNGSYQPTGFLQMDKEPKDIVVEGNLLYILMADGISVEKWDLIDRNRLASYYLMHPADQISLTDKGIIASGSGTIGFMNLQTMSYEVIDTLFGARCVNTISNRIYGLFDNGVIEYDVDFNEINRFAVSDRGSYIYPGENEFFIASFNKALVYHYKNGNISNTFGIERRQTAMERICADGAMVAVYGDSTIDVYHGGKLAVTMDGAGVKDIALDKGRLYVLKGSSVSAYELTAYETQEWSLNLINTLEANSNYDFSSMAVANNSIYISETSSGKVLKVGTDLKVFTTQISGLTNPKAVAYNSGRLYVAQDKHLSMFDMGGALLHEVEGEYHSITYKGALYAIANGGKEVLCFNNELKWQEPVKYEGYFLGLQDIYANGNRLYICDSSRKEIMVFAKENLDITENNISVYGASFNGTVIKGQTVKVRVSGAGMFNFLPNIGDVRYKPIHCGIDAKTEFKENAGGFEAEISVQNVGNYTLKIVYQKQIYYFDGWRDVQTVEGGIVKDIAITVDINEDYVNQTINIVKMGLYPMAELLIRMCK